MLASVFITPSMDFNQIKSSELLLPVLITEPSLPWCGKTSQQEVKLSRAHLRMNICNIGSQIGFIRVHRALMCTRVPLKSSHHLDIRSNDNTIPAAVPADLVSLWQRRQIHWGRNCVLPLPALLVIHNHHTMGGHPPPGLSLSPPLRYILDVCPLKLLVGHSSCRGLSSAVRLSRF